MEFLEKKGLLFLLLIVFSYSAIAQQSDLEKAFSDSYTFEYHQKYEEAVKSIKPFYDKSSYAINYRLGWLTYLAGQYSQSLKYYEQSIKLRPLSIEALLGVTYPASAIGNWENVIQRYNQVLAIAPNNYLANINLAKIYLNRAEYEKAEPYFRLILNQFPFTYEVVINAAWNNFYLGKYREAKVLFKNALLLNPKDESALLGLSKIK